MAFAENQLWYTNQTQDLAYYYIPQTEISIATSGNQANYTNIFYPVDVVNGSSLYCVNNATWKATPKLQNIGNSFYTATITGMYNSGDVIHTTYLAPDGSQFVGTTFQVVLPQATGLSISIDMSSISGIVNSAVVNAIKGISFSPTIMLRTSS